MSFKSAIYSIVSIDSGVSAIVGTKIYPDAAPSSATCPYVVYSIVSTNQIHTISTTTTTTKFRIQFSCFAFDSATNSALVEAIKTVLDVHRFSGEGFSFIAFEDESIDLTQSPQDGSEQFTYQTNVDYMIWFTKF